MMRKQKTRRKKCKKGYLAAIAIIILIAGTTTGSTLAYLNRQQSLNNTFQVAHATTKVLELFENNTIKNVRVKNTGNTPVYIRAAIIASWQDENGDSVGGYSPEEMVDYTLKLGQISADGKWILAKDGFYYYTMPVDENEETADLISECKESSVSEHQKDGLFLSVDIASQSIQTEPEKAVLEAWGQGNGPVSRIGSNGELIIQEKGGN